MEDTGVLLTMHFKPWQADKMDEITRISDRKHFLWDFFILLASSNKIDYLTLSIQNNDKIVISLQDLGALIKQIQWMIELQQTLVVIIC